MFATFRRKDNDRLGTAVLSAEEPTGPFSLHSEGPVTPADWSSLDGTLYIDETDQPWMVFCHEWRGRRRRDLRHASESRSNGGRLGARNPVPCLRRRLGHAVPVAPLSRAGKLCDRRPVSVSNNVGESAPIMGQLCGRPIRARRGQVANRQADGSLASRARTLIRQRRRARHGVPYLERSADADRAYPEPHAG